MKAFQKVVPDGRCFSLTWLLTLTKSFASLVCRLVSLFRRHEPICELKVMKKRNLCSHPLFVIATSGRFVC